MTVLGLVTVLAVAGAWMFRREAVQLVLAVAAVFPQSAGLLVADRGFPLFYLAVCVVAVLAIPTILMSLARRPEGVDLGRPGRLSADIVGVGLVVWGAVISFAGPRIFAGLPVFDPSLGVDVQVGALSRLEPSMSNQVQTAYLLIAVMSVLMAGRLFPVDGRAIGVMVWATVLLAFGRLVSGSAWPLELIQTMPGYPYQNGANGFRLAGTFYEPSVLGLYLAAAAGYFGARLLSRRMRTSRRGQVAAVVGLGLVAVEFVFNGSGTALMGLVLVGALGAAVLVTGLLRGRGLRIQPVAVVGVVGVLGVAITQIPTLYALTFGVVATKTESSSFVARGASNERSLGILTDTFGLGVGLGGNRPSSLFMFVLSGLGVVGAALLIALIVVALRRGVGSRQIPSVWVLLGGLTAGAVAVPDLSTPLLWVALAACVAPAITERVGPAPDEPGVSATSAPGVGSRVLMPVLTPALTPRPTLAARR